MNNIISVASLLFLGWVFGVAQQAGPDMNKYLALIESGAANQVRSELPTLLTKHPNNPGVLYLQALTTTDGAEAVRVYQSIVDNFPKSEWADDALYKVYQFYYAIGLYRTAEIKLDQLKRDYAGSRYVTGNADVETKGMIEEAQPLPASPDARVVEQSVIQQPETTSQPEPAGQFVLQVGAYSSLVNAEKQKLFFEDLKYPVEVISKVKDSRSLYIVLVGNFATYDDAKARGADIKQQFNVDSMVISR